MGKTLVIIGLLLAGLGGALLVAERFGLGRLPGDLVFRRRGLEVHFPIVTSIVVSIVLTVLINLLLRRR